MTLVFGEISIVASGIKLASSLSLQILETFCFLKADAKLQFETEWTRCPTLERSLIIWILRCMHYGLRQTRYDLYPGCETNASVRGWHLETPRSHLACFAFCMFWKWKITIDLRKFKHIYTEWSYHHLRLLVTWWRFFYYKIYWVRNENISLVISQYRIIDSWMELLCYHGLSIGFVVCGTIPRTTYTKCTIATSNVL
jgi:hypothetical protein